MEEIQTEQVQQSVKKRRWPFVLLAIVILAAAAGGVKVYLMDDNADFEGWDIAEVCSAAADVVRDAEPKGYHDYTVQKQQYYVEYSDEYPYWDVLTVEYPALAGAPEEIEHFEQINERLYDTAMDRVNYWHLTPNDEVKELQEEYHIFASDVQCDVAYHSQYLMSVNYRELYAPINPVWYVYTTQRALTVDLLTGESYTLGDVLKLDEDFVTLWVDKFNEKMEEEMITSEDVDIFVDWFNGSDEELEEYFNFVPFFYVTQEGNFVIGVSLDPKVAGLSGSDPSNSTFYAELTARELMPYRTESVFWGRYDKSESTGEVFPCEEKQENLWLGDQAGVWDYWEERR